MRPIRPPYLEDNTSFLNHLTWRQSIWPLRCALSLVFFSLPARSTLEADQRRHILHLSLESTSSSIHQHVSSPSAWQQPRPDQASGNALWWTRGTTMPLELSACVFTCVFLGRGWLGMGRGWSRRNQVVSLCSQTSHSFAQVVFLMSAV